MIAAIKTNRKIRRTGDTGTPSLSLSVRLGSKFGWLVDIRGSIATKAGFAKVVHPTQRGVDTLLITKLTQAPLFRFILVGGAAFLLDAGIVWGLTHLGIGPYVARVASLCASITFTFVLNRYLTYQAAHPISMGEVIGYIGASGLGILLNYVIYATCLKLGLGWLIAMALGTIIASGFNFIAYGRIFKKH
jgi:putative flippase GtrA